MELSLSEKILAVVVEKFPNGIRADRIVENQIRLKFKEKYCAEIPSAFNIFDLIKTHAVECDEKFYLFDERSKQKLLQLLEEIFSAGNDIVFYEKFLERHGDFLSVGVLKALLADLNCGYFCGEDFFAQDEKIELKSLLEEILRDKESRLEEICAQLSYVPEEKIRQELKADEKIFSTRNGGYISLEAVQFDEEEIVAAGIELSTEIKRNGYVLLDENLLPNNFALNSNLSGKTLCEAIFIKFWKENFVRQNKVLTAKNSPHGMKDLLRRFCATREEFFADELFGYAKEIFSYRVLNVPLEVALEKFTRVSEALFVKDSLVKFDVGGIDEALDFFVQDKIVALRAVKSFVTFPPVEGYVWNLYLLESFLRKLSLRYRFLAPSFNNKCIGAIYPNFMRFKDYLEVQAEVLIQEKILLHDKRSVEKFLIQAGFRATCTKDSTEKIIHRASKLKDR